MVRSGVSCRLSALRLRCGGMGQFSPCIEQVRRAVVLVSVRGGFVGSVICRVGMGWWSFGAHR